MGILKVVIVGVSGLFLVAAAVCAGLFYQTGTIQSLGATVMFMCFGAFGIFLAYNLASLRPAAGRQASPSRR